MTCISLLTLNMDLIKVHITQVDRNRIIALFYLLLLLIILRFPITLLQNTSAHPF